MLRTQKQIGLVSLLSLLSVSIYAQEFDGFYFGGGLGSSQSRVNVNQSLEINAVLFNTTNIFDIVKNNKETLTDTSFLGDLNLGFGHVFAQRWYLGIEGNAVWQDLETDAAQPLQQPDGSLNIIEKTTVKLSNQFNIALVPGIVFDKNTLLYGKVGVAWGNFDVKNSANYDQTIQAPITLSSSNSFSDSGYENGLLLGLGIEHYLTQNLSMKLEYTHANYGTIHDSAPMTSAINNADPANIPITGTVTDSSKASVSTNSVMLGMSYHFA